MKRTILKFSMAVLLMGMFAMLPSCKNEATEEAATKEAVAEPESTTEPEAAVDPIDTSDGKGGKTGGNPPPTNP